jgi:hypothetical protein
MVLNTDLNQQLIEIAYLKRLTFLHQMWRPKLNKVEVHKFSLYVKPQLRMVLKFNLSKLFVKQIICC